ncbi:uncharacterized protein BDW43DRAFT_279434 [Aspergillus alliaceus]|uniref:uncharacterized protein n=1 Tax=Petromyces alliaceus TaxID=209559 RepID=UPI0012A469FB|nr:uncharacterized protein BDW43DRAFT_279434 [Aspergillus alliaceus]KAB8232446.1 hypothetical protein BDW43DRAFT_279434 [Aspergillus alliaceus]
MVLCLRFLEPKVDAAAIQLCVSGLQLCARRCKGCRATPFLEVLCRALWGLYPENYLLASTFKIEAKAGTLRDLFNPNEGGKAMVFYIFPLVGQVLGPIAGGFLTGCIHLFWSYWCYLPVEV